MSLAVRDERGKFSLFGGRSIIFGRGAGPLAVHQIANRPCRAIKIVVMMRLVMPMRCDVGRRAWPLRRSETMSR